MTAKKILNDVNHVVDEELDGLASLYNNSLRRISGTNIIVRKDSPQIGKVAIISGGGSGHEPMQCGFVGKGVLDAAVAGDVFTAPPPDQIYRAIKEVDGHSGVLLIVNNFAGDIMNFKIAEELASGDGVEIEHVIVNDDVAIPIKENRRGVAGGILVEKIAGTKAEQGSSLREVREIAQRVIDNTRSMGVALTPCTLPRTGKPMFELGQEEMELGIGVHGEKGVERTKLISADEIAKILFDRISKDLGLKRGNEVALLVNGMGATPLMELLIFSRKVIQLLRGEGVTIFRSIAGSPVTTLDMAGLSLTLVRLDEEMKRMLVMPDSAPYFPKIV